MCFGTFWNEGATFVLELLDDFALLAALRSLSSLSAAACEADRISVFCAAFFLISSSEAPTTARWTLPARRLRFFVDVSVRPFLWRRRQACVHTNLAAFLR